MPSGVLNFYVKMNVGEDETSTENLIFRGKVKKYSDEKFSISINKEYQNVFGKTL